MSSPVDKHLDEVAIAQFLFKSDKMKAAALTVLEKAINMGRFWPDQVDLDFLGEKDRNCIGSVFRILSVPKPDENGKIRGTGLGFIDQTGSKRRSRRKGRSGGIIFEYYCVAAKRQIALRLLLKHDPTKSRQEFTQLLPGFQS